MNETRHEEVVKLREGRYVVIDGHPCKIKKIQTSAPGKHGHAKARVDAVSLFDGSKHGFVKPSDARVEVPIVDKRQAQVLSVSGGTAQLMDSQTYQTFEVEIPKGMSFDTGSEIYYWKVMGKTLMQRED